MLRYFLSLVVAAGLAVGASQSVHAATPLKIGVSAGPYADILRFAADLAKKDGIDAQIIEFTDWTLPNEALNSGDLDLNNFQHQPYLDNQVKTRGYDIISLDKSIIVPFGLYSKKVATIAEIKDGATTAIPNDPSNAARGLQLLERAGLIKLKPGADIKATIADIVENPKHLTIKELDAAQLPRALDDLDFSVVSLNYAVNAEEQRQSDHQTFHRDLSLGRGQGLRSEAFQWDYPHHVVNFPPSKAAVICAGAADRARRGSRARRPAAC
jgi:D-methionine transport system substrate-binding protein